MGLGRGEETEFLMRVRDAGVHGVYVGEALYFHNYNPQRLRICAKVTALGLSDNVIFTGYIPESEKTAHYNLADVYVMPSIGEGVRNRAHRGRGV